MIDKTKPSFASDLLREIPVLPQYRRQRSVGSLLVRSLFLLGCCIFAGLSYGFLYVLLPPFLLIYLLVPVSVLVLLVVWALPDIGRAPTGAFAAASLVYVGVVLLWPNYLAIALPGLPWLSLRRVVMPMAILLALLSCSLASDVRRTWKDVLSRSKVLTVVIILYTTIQIITTFLSGSLAFSINFTVNYILLSTSCYFVFSYILSINRNMARLEHLFLIASLVLTIIGVLEWLNGRILWADHIPGFLKVDDDIVQRILEGTTRDSAYRVTAVFSVSLVLAEALAILTPFTLNRVFASESVLKAIGWLCLDVTTLFVISTTQSRLGIVGWITVHAFYILGWAVRRWRWDRIDIVGPAGTLFAAAGGAIVLFAMFTVPAVRNRTIAGGSTGLSDAARAQQFDLLWPKLLANPFGYGGGSSGEVLGYRQPGGLLSVDSYVITLLIDHGIVGFLLFSAALFCAFFSMAKLALGPDLSKGSMALTLGSAVLVIIQIRFVLSQSDNLPLIFTILGACAAYQARVRRSSLTAPTGA